MEKLERILTICCEYYDQPVLKIKGKERYKKFVMVRHSFFYLARNYTNYSLKEIGKFLNKDHTTVMNSINIVKDCFYTKQYLYNDINKLRLILEIEFQTEYTKVIFTFDRKINFDLFVTNITENYGAIKYEVVEN